MNQYQLIQPTRTMSYLRQSEAQPKKIEPTKPAAAKYPLGYTESQTMVQLSPAPKPISTQDFDHNQHLEQKQVCEQLKQEDLDLFAEKNVIMKVVGNERQYKQRQQFSSKSSVESLCDVLEKTNTVMKCQFVRPGFNASNTVLMCTPAMLRQAIKEESDEFSLKKLRINLASDSGVSPENGTMFLSMIQNPKTGNHSFYSLDYHVGEVKDDKLFSIY